jgi:dUTP pyrophosphatase
MLKWIKSKFINWIMVSIEEANKFEEASNKKYKYYKVDMPDNVPHPAIPIVYHSDVYLKKETALEKHGDLIDLRYCGVNKVFGGSVNYDFKTKKLKYKKGAIFRVNLGIAMNLPQGTKANVPPRSGTRKNFGVLLTNSVGQIDNNYNGTNDEWMAEFYAIQDGEMNLGDRVVQFEIIDAMRDYRFKQVDKLENINRGGYGSSGK